MEHAKWFPRCTYVKQRKDDEFIRRAHAQRDAVRYCFLLTHQGITATVSVVCK